MINRSDYIEHLRLALNNLYEPDFLRKSPLIKLFGIEQRFDVFTALQKILIEAIEEMEPSPEEPLDSPAWWNYGPLYYRFLQQLDRQQVAEQLGVSVRQLNRRQRSALETLADRLWTKFCLTENTEKSGISSDDRPESLFDELAWLRDSEPEATGFIETLHSALERILPLSRRYDVTIQIQDAGEIPPVSVQPLALKQVLINLLSLAICLPGSKTVSIHLQLRQETMEVIIQTETIAEKKINLSSQEIDNLEICQRLLAMFDGTLSANFSQGFSAVLTLPLYNQVPVLVIDDNKDTLQLFSRYTAKSHFRVIGIQQTDQLFEVVDKISPQIILLDVMMPRVDGWEVLATLRQHPKTSHIPIIVCTIMPQSELAYSLGARFYLQKPVTQQNLIAALNQIAGFED